MSSEIKIVREGSKPEEKIIDVPVALSKNAPPNVDLSFLDRIVAPHTKKARLVTEKDIPRVTEEAKILHMICLIGAYAMAHAQIDDKDPLDFFVTSDKKIVINPKVLKHSNYEIDSMEGCVTFPGVPWTSVKRWHKMEVEYVTIMLDPEDKEKFKLSSPIQESLSGRQASVYQHEMDHAVAKYVYTFTKE